MKTFSFLLFKWPCRLWNNDGGGEEEEETTKAYLPVRNTNDAGRGDVCDDVKKTKQGNEENDGTDVTKKANDEDGADSCLFTLYVTLVIIIIACPILLLKVDIVVEGSASY